MTEADWLAATDPHPMLEHLRATVYSRKLRLFAVACCRRIDNVMTTRGRTAVCAAELFADGIGTWGELHPTWRAVGYPKVETRRYAAMAARAASCSPGYNGAASAAACSLAASASTVEPQHQDTRRREERIAQAHLLRCIFGNPFRPVAFDRRWRSETAVALAAGIYDARAFDRLPILADALEDAGCDHADLLAHLRASGPHARGCWAVDLVLGKV